MSLNAIFTPDPAAEETAKSPLMKSIDLDFLAGQLTQWVIPNHTY
jgi:hypothetical protein